MKLPRFSPPAYSLSRFSTWAAVFLLTFLLLLPACASKDGGNSSTGSSDGQQNISAGTFAKTPLRIYEKPLTEQEQELVNLLSRGDTRIYDYELDDSARGISFCVEEYKDGRLTILSEVSGSVSSNGSFAIIPEPERVIFSWDGGLYTFNVNTSSGYKSSFTSYIHDLSSIPYNTKQAVGMVVCSETNKIMNCDVGSYDQLITLDDKDFDRVLYFTVAFTDFPLSEGLVSYHGIVRDKSQLSEETLQWLEKYNEKTIMEQLSFSSMPSEFIEPHTGKITFDAVAP